MALIQELWGSKEYFLPNSFFAEENNSNWRFWYGKINPVVNKFWS